jgi:hypothetical protein
MVLETSQRKLLLSLVRSRTVLSTLSFVMYLYSLPILSFGVAVLAQSSFVTHVARQETNSEGGRMEQTAASLDMPTASTPTPSAGPLSEVQGVDSNITSWAWLWGWHGCSNDQKTAILSGLQEAHAVLSTDGVYNIDRHWNDFATVEFLGNPNRLWRDNKKDAIRGEFEFTYGNASSSPLTLPLDKFNRAYKYQQSWFSYYDTDVYCTSDLEDVCARKEPGYIWTENAKSNKEYLKLAFCERYFKLGTLQGIYDLTSADDQRSHLNEYENRARAWISAMMRISWIRGSDNMVPQLVRYPERSSPPRFAESASEAKLLAKSNGGYSPQSKPLESPSNYAWYALAQWVQKKSGDYPQQPYVPDDAKPRPQI